MEAKQIMVWPGDKWDGVIVHHVGLPERQLPESGIETGFYGEVLMPWPSVERVTIAMDRYYIACPDALFIIAVPGDLTLSMALRTMFEAVAGPEPVYRGNQLAFLFVDGNYALWDHANGLTDWHTMSGDHDLLVDRHWFRFFTTSYDPIASTALSLLFDHYARARRPQEAAG